MSTVIISFVAALLGGGFFGFIQYLLDRRDKKKGFQARVESRLSELEKGQSRTNLMILMEHHPHDHYQVLQEAQRYFVDLHGNWYMHSLFEEYCKNNSVVVPGWYAEVKEKKKNE